MPNRRTTFSKFIIEEERGSAGHDADLAALLNDIQTACKFIASAVSRGALDAATGLATGLNASEIVQRECQWGGQLAGMLSKGSTTPTTIPNAYPHGRFLLVFDALDGSRNLDVNVTVGTIFAVLRAPHGVADPAPEDFLQPGSQQVAAGFALYGPTATIVLTLGDGVNGFTLDREIGAYTLTHPNMQIAEDTREFAIDNSRQRFWEPPISHYVEECVAGKAGDRGVDYTMRWVDSLVAEMHRILVRGGMLIAPSSFENERSEDTAILNLLCEANPMAMIIEQAGGAASTGRERILDLVPTSLDQRTPAILGSRNEVERLVAYHETYDSGEELVLKTPLFNVRSLYRTT